MITATMKIDRLLRDLESIPGAVDKTLRPWLLKNARATVSSGGKIKGIVQATPPFMLSESGDKGSAAKKRGETAVARDIHRVYGGAGELYARIKQRDAHQAAAFWKLIKHHQTAQANIIARAAVGMEIKPFDGGTEHKARRNSSTGRVTGKAPTAFTDDTKALAKYIKAKQKLVGLLASSVIAAANATLGKINAVPAWVRRHSPTWGSIQEQGTATARTIRITMSAVFGMKGMQHRMDTVRDFRLRAMAREIPNILKHGLKQHLPKSLT